MPLKQQRKEGRKACNNRWRRQEICVDEGGGKGGRRGAFLHPLWHHHIS